MKCIATHLVYFKLQYIVMKFCRRRNISGRYVKDIGWESRVEFILAKHQWVILGWQRNDQTD